MASGDKCESYSKIHSLKMDPSVWSISANLYQRVHFPNVPLLEI